MWSKIYFLFLFLRFYLVFQPLLGYIHPDEFFQGPEKIAGDILRYDVITTWEYSDQHAIRSPLLWYMLCGYPFSVVRALRTIGITKTFDSYWLVVAPRFVMALLSVLTDGAIMRIASSLGSSPYFAGCLSATSYVTLIFYTRTFSNSLESFFLAMLLVCTCEYINSSNSKLPKRLAQSKASTMSKGNSHEGKGIAGASSTEDNSDGTVNKANTPVSNDVAVDDISDSANVCDSGSSSDADIPLSSGIKARSSSSAPVIVSKPNNTLSFGKDSEEIKLHSVNDADKVMFESAEDADESSVYGKKTTMADLMEKHAVSASVHLSSKYHPSSASNIDDKTKGRVGTRHSTSVVISMIITAGTWNRPTFIGFALVPALYWVCQGRLPRSLKDWTMAVMNGLLNVPYFINTALVFILFDTSYYNRRRSSSLLYNMSILEQLVITPLNFLLYNKNTDNLSEHGLHPWYLHLLVNCPLLFGPLVAFLLLFLYMVFYISNRAHRNLMVMLFLSTVVPLALLSAFPHQEARFIIPLLVPCVIITAYGLHLINSKALYLIFILFWIPHNVILGFLFGGIHQAGVVPSLFYLNNLKSAGRFNQGETIIYHRTYMPPKSLLQIHLQESEYIKLIDLQGQVDDVDLEDTLSKFDSFYLITPYHETQISTLLGSRFSVDREISFYPHLSLEDPPDIDAILTYDQTGAPDLDATMHSLQIYLTLNIYRVTNRKLIVQTYPSSADSTHNRHNIDTGNYEVMEITLPKVLSLNM